MLIIFLISFCYIVVECALPQDPCWLVCDEFSAAHNVTGFDLCGPSASRCDETTNTCTFLYWSREEGEQEGLINSEVEQGLTEEELTNPLTCPRARQMIAHALEETSRPRRVIPVSGQSLVNTTAHPAGNYTRDSFYNISATNGTFSKNKTTVRRVVPIYTSARHSSLPSVSNEMPLYETAFDSFSKVHKENPSYKTVLDSSSLATTVHEEFPLYVALPELTSSDSLSLLGDSDGIELFNTPGFENRKIPGRPTKSPGDKESDNI
jgi:hypothetical protein